MTVLIGVLCSDGVVIGSDSAATFAAGNFRTIEQPCKKINVIKNNIIVAGTGFVGQGQRFNAVVEKAFSDTKLLTHLPVDICTQLSQLAVQNFSATQAPKDGYGALVAFHINGTPHLCEFIVNGFQPELKTADIWYVSMGSGQNIADPFLGFIRKTFWGDKMPKLQDAIFAVTWTLQHVIELNPGGIQGPAQVAVLNPIENPKARILSELDLGEHHQNIAGIGKYLQDYKTTLTTKASATPEVPKVL